MLQINHITKSFTGSDFVLQDVSVNFGTGLTMLIGPNGAGKSTLLRIVAGIMEPDSGCLLFNNRDVYSGLRNYKCKLGYLPQSFGFYEHMTGMEFLRYMTNLKGLHPRVGQKRAEYVADLLGIQQQCSKKIAAWSLGLRQRLGLAQALLNDPDLLVLDEPFCGLDSEEFSQTAKLLSQLSRDKVVIISSHIMAGLDLNKLLLIMNGKLQFSGLPTVFIDEAQGQIWAVEVAKSDWFRLQHHYHASAVIFKGEQCSCKIVSRAKPDLPGAKAIFPVLEDAYFFWLQRVKQIDQDNVL